MFDRTQWVLAGMSLTLSFQLSQLAAAVSIGKALKTAQTNSSEPVVKVFKEGLQPSQQGTADSKKSEIAKYEEALKQYRAMGNRLVEAGTLHNIANIYSVLGEKQKALEYYSQSLLLSRGVGDQSKEAITFYNMAFIKRDLGNLTEALNDIEASMKVIENFRTTIPTLQKYYDFYINLLMQLHKTNPNFSYDIKASEASERAKNHDLPQIGEFPFDFGSL